jgi:hypothetical protein
LIHFYAEYNHAECRYAECRYAECRYAECRGAKNDLLLNMTPNSLIMVSAGSPLTPIYITISLFP